MKKVFLSITISLIAVTSSAQWTTNGNNVTIDKNIGIGTENPQAKLDVNGDIKANTLYLNTTSWVNGWGVSQIYYPGHALVIGSPEENYNHNSLQIKPGGSTKGGIFSTLSMYTAPTAGVQESKILLHTAGSSYFNGGNIGIGTENPQAKLDVNGDIKANALYLNTTSWVNGWGASRIYYPGHALVIGSPEENYNHNSLEIKPGGSTKGAIFSTLSMYTAPTAGVQESKILLHTAGSSYFNGGNIGIGTENPQAKLDVRGVISAEEVKVQILTGADHVFNTDYDLKPLSEVKAYVEENKHLPEIPSEKQMQKNGLNINEFQIKLLQKIEELTLYVIKQDEEIKKLKKSLSEK